LALTTISSGGFITKDNLSNIVSNNLQIFTLSITLLFPIFNFYLLFNIFGISFSSAYIAVDPLTNDDMRVCIPDIA